MMHSIGCTRCQAGGLLQLHSRACGAPCEGCYSASLYMAELRGRARFDKRARLVRTAFEWLISLQYPTSC